MRSIIFHYTNGYIHHDTQLSEHLQNPHAKTSRVAVVLGYFDGQDYISDQLQSILHQTHSSVHIYLCDDKSEPRFDIEGLNLNQDQLSQISIDGIRSRNIGFTNNFLNALANVSDKFEYFAFSDQDDIWHKNKLEKAITALEEVPFQFACTLLRKNRNS